MTKILLTQGVIYSKKFKEDYIILVELRLLLIFFVFAYAPLLILTNKTSKSRHGQPNYDKLS